MSYRQFAFIRRSAEPSSAASAPSEVPIKHERTVGVRLCFMGDEGGLSVGRGSRRGNFAGLEQAERTLADVDELVRHDGIQAGGVEAELNEPALRWLQIERLRAALSGIGLQRVRTLFEHCVEDGANDVE